MTPYYYRNAIRGVVSAPHYQLVVLVLSAHVVVAWLLHQFA